MTSEGPTRAEAAAHILARETGRRMRAIQVRIDEVEEERKSALEAVASRLDGHDGTDARQDVLIDGLRVGLETVQAITTAIDAAHGETRELTAAQAQELASIASRLAANEQVDAAQDAELTGLTGRVEGLEARAPVPGPPGPKGERGPAGPPGRTGGYVGGGGSATIQSNGTTVANRPILNFVSGATVTDNGANNRVDITVSGGGSGAINSVTASSGLSVTGTSDLTITNTGVRSLTGSGGLTVSASTGDVTLTAPTVTGGTGISVSGSGTTSITVSATGVNSVSAGTGISVSGTTALTVSATGVQSLTAGNGITVSGTTTPTVSASLAAGSGIGISGTTTLTVSNSGVTSIVAGTNVSVSGATGAVTVNAPAFATAGSSAVGDSAAAGTATTAARSDHVHGREAFGTPGASAVADTASAGTATTVARSDHRHSREAFGTPVVVNGQTTSLSTGSLTTLARADHVHTMSNVPVFLATTTLASATASYTFSSIRAGFSAIELIWAAQSEFTGASVDAMNIRVNGNTGSVYNSSFGNQTMAFVGYINSRTANYYNAPSPGRLIFTDVSTTTRKMSGFSFYGYNGSTTAYDSGTWMARPVYETTGSVLSSLTILFTYANMSAGSTFWLYGIP